MITNDELLTALKEPDNKKIMNMVCAKYKIKDDDAYDCQLLGMWRTLKTYNPNKQKKFTSWLYHNIAWQCLAHIKNNKKNVSLNEDLEYYEDDKNDYKEIFDKYKLLKHRFVDKMTLHEIAKIYNVSHVCIRNRIIKILKELKKEYI